MPAADFVLTLFDGQSNPNKVTVALTTAVNAQARGHSACLILMVEAVALGLPGATEGINIGAPFEPASALLEKFLSQGGTLAVCRACMVHNGIDETRLDPRCTVITAPDVVDLLMQAKGSLQVT